MRQAGRYMSEYRALRERYSLLELCRTPDLATEVTLQPVRRLEVDAAILFSDLLLPLEPMGIRFDFIRGEGPQIENPIQSEEDIDNVRRFEPREALSHVLQAIRQVKVELAGRVPLIGFAGGAVHARPRMPSKAATRTTLPRPRRSCTATPRPGTALCDLIADVISDYLAAQIEAGVDAVQVFDSWVGALNARDYREFILPHTKRIFDSLRGHDVPTIHFGVGTGSIFPEIREAGGDVIGADWRTPLNEAWQRIGHDRAVQGNLDPTLLLGPLDRVLNGADDVLARAGGRAGHIFNLGHGILPSTPVEHVQALARHVHQASRRRG